MDAINTSFKENLTDFLTAWLLSWGISTAGLLCLFSAFPLPADSRFLIYVPGLCSMAASIAYLFLKGWIAVTASWVVGLGIILIWFPDILINGAKMILETLLAFYSSAYSSLSLSVGYVPLGYTATLPMCLWGAITATLCAWTILRQQTPAGVLILSALPLALCLVVVDTPPDCDYLFLYLICAALLVLTQGCRRRSRVSGNRLCLALILPMLLVVLGLHEFLPERSYSRKPWSDALLHQVETLLPDLQAEKTDPPHPDTYNSNFPHRPLTIGPPKYVDRPIMSVTAENSGLIYLRGNTYGQYTQVAWDTLDFQQYDDSYAANRGLFLSYEDSEVDLQTIHIRTHRPLAVLYTPYYLHQLPKQGNHSWDCAIRNSDNIKEYDISYCKEAPQALSSPDSSSFSEDASPYDEFVREYYTKLPWDTRRSAADYLRAHGFTQSLLSEPNPTAYAQRIAQLVRSSAVYDLSTPAMPRGEDFAIWFLNESPTGYCVHFASASVVLLRAAGIPARYVTGYLVNAEAGEAVTVLDRNAHAWAEYYVQGVGWIPLDATPADAMENILPPAETTQPDSTEETTGPEESAAPTTGTQPTTPAASAAEETTPAPSAPSEPFSVPFWVFLIPVPVLLALAYSPAVLFVRRRKFRKLPDNEAFLLYWHYCSCMARWLKFSQDTCTDLALKARFSQHSVDKEDWKMLHDWQDSLCANLSVAPLIKRFLIHRILLWDRRL